ncbi:MAG: trypsin-like peptidase domain-containing protein [Planctomycetota bacterium]
MVGLLIFDVHPSSWTREDFESLVRLPSKPSDEPSSPAISDPEVEIGDLRQTSREPIKWTRPAKSIGEFDWTVPNGASSPQTASHSLEGASTIGEAGSDSPTEWTIERRVSAVSVRLESADGAIGSGVIVAVGPHSFEVLTADHVIGPLATGPLPGWRVTHMVMSHGETRLNGDSQSHIPGMRWAMSRSLTIVRRSAAEDLALLRVSRQDLSETPVAISNLRAISNTLRPSDPLETWVGEEVWTVDTTINRVADVGSTFVESIEVGRPTLAAAANRYLKLEVQSKPGMSGSGLFIRADPIGAAASVRLIGIASGNSNGRAHYVAPSVIADFMSKMPRGSVAQ